MPSNDIFFNNSIAATATLDAVQSAPRQVLSITVKQWQMQFILSLIGFTCRVASHESSRTGAKECSCLRVADGIDSVLSFSF